MFRQYRPIDRGEQIVVGCDTAAGGSDFCVAQFMSKTRGDVPLVFHANVTATFMTDQLAPVLECIHDATTLRPVVAYERQNGGSFEMDRLGALNRAGKFTLYKMAQFGREDIVETPKYGWDTNSATRPKMLQDLKEAIDNQLIVLYDRQTVGEMLSFIITKTSTIEKAQAENGAHDDLVMALAIAYQLYQSVQTEVSHEDIEKDTISIINQLPKENYE